MKEIPPWINTERMEAAYQEVREGERRARAGRHIEEESQQIEELKKLDTPTLETLLGEDSSPYGAHVLSTILKGRNVLPDLFDRTHARAKQENREPALDTPR